MESAGDLLDSPILAVGGAAVPIADWLQCSRIERRDPVDPRCSVVSPDFPPGGRVVLEAIYRGCGRQERGSTGSLNDQVGSFPKDKTAAAIGIESIGQECETADRLDAGIQCDSPPVMLKLRALSGL